MYQPNYQYNSLTQFVERFNAALDDMNDSVRRREEVRCAERGEDEPTAVRKFIGSFIDRY